jgi:hypothetical protein
MVEGSPKYSVLRIIAILRTVPETEHCDIFGPYAASWLEPFQNSSGRGYVSV